MLKTSQLIQFLVLIIITVVVMSALFFSVVNNVTISDHIETSTANRLITWNLNSGQKVEGSINYSMMAFDSTFKIVEEYSQSQIFKGSIENSHGDFSFKTNADELYVLYGPMVTENNKLDYTYTISTLIMGLDSATFIGLTIVIGVVTELIILALKGSSKKSLQ